MKTRQFILIFLTLIVLCVILIDIDNKLSTNNTRLGNIYDKEDSINKNVDYIYNYTTDTFDAVTDIQSTLYDTRDSVEKIRRNLPY